MGKLIKALGSQRVVMGTVKGRELSLTLYDGEHGGKVLNTAETEIPPGTDSPKLAVEKVLTQLANVQFAHIREVECDHSDPAVEKVWAERPNLVQDPGFEDGPRQQKGKAENWGAILGADRYAPPVLESAGAEKLGEDRVAVVSKGLAGVVTEQAGYCLMMRMSKNVAENNGLACESIWIPVENGAKYRFGCKYHSTGPVPRLFLKGFAEQGDQFGDKKDPEATRREFYRCQVLPRKANEEWEKIEMDFTPEPLKATYPKIQWLRIDLYIYLSPGDVFFDDVSLKKISK